MRDLAETWSMMPGFFNPTMADYANELDRRFREQGIEPCVRPWAGRTFQAKPPSS